MTNYTGAEPPKSVDVSDDSESSADTKIESFEASNDSFEHVHSLWFEDGNVVIVAQESGFRVHKGVLARHSAAFVKILNDSNDSDTLSDQLGMVIGTEIKMEGSKLCSTSPTPHTTLGTSSASSMTASSDYSKYTRSDDFADLAAAARLAHKYTVPVVLSEAMLRLQQLFPPTFDIWEATEDVRATAERRVRPQDAIEAVNLFRALGSADGADKMLPIALYLCCQLAPGELLRGHRRADGTLERLAVDDVELCWKLQKTLAERATTMAEQLCRSGPWLVYADKKKCKCFNCLDKSVPWRWLTDRVRGGDPLGRMLRDRIDWAEREFKVCDKCLSKLRELEMMIRGAFWVELHHDYGRDDSELQ
ncbi:hypothetical protein LXA43DRAFT_1181239 [Ganoderma leucocontextum]|nr:hypothetical protein LXA43DRAFT_1181239 [Ganoderma leucocontextum]